MKKLPEITMKDWLEAEKLMLQKAIPARPKGSVTVNEYSMARGCSETNAARILRNMAAQGLATRQQWHDNKWVYFLNKK